MKYLFIDGNNTCYRVFWTHRQLSHNQASVGLLFGFFKTLINLKKVYNDHKFIIAWDSKSKRRIAESEKGVIDGIVDYSYKSARKEKAEQGLNDDFKEMFEQMNILKEKLNLINVEQVFVEGYEADDVICSFCDKIQKNEPESKITILTSDKDYYQLLSDNIEIYDPIKKRIIRKDVFIQEYGIDPSQWVDCCSISGDSGDSIQGISGWGDVTSLKYIKEYGNLSGVLNGVELKSVKNKKEESLLKGKDRLFLAKSLKQMDIVDVPLRFESREFSKKEIQEFFIKYGFSSLSLEIGRLIS